MVVKKVNIDELVDLLLDMRQTTSYVDMSIEEGNILKVRRWFSKDKQNGDAPNDEITFIIV